MESKEVRCEWIYLASRSLCCSEFLVESYGINAIECECKDFMNIIMRGGGEGLRFSPDRTMRGKINYADFSVFKF